MKKLVLIFIWILISFIDISCAKPEDDGGGGGGLLSKCVCTFEGIQTEHGFVATQSDCEKKDTRPGAECILE
jgi:hypothetical protein